MKSDKRMITLLPSKTTRNIHLETNIKMFEELGIENTNMDNQDLSWRDLRNYQLIYLNWFENIDGGNFYMPILRYIRRLLQIYRIKRAGLKVLYTKHNKFPHDARYPILSRDIYRKTCDLADVIIAFNDDANEDLKKVLPGRDYSKKIKRINPVNYIGSYPENTNSMFYERLKPYSDSCIVTFVGKIMRYKNIEFVIKAAGDLRNENIIFVIAGAVDGLEYKKQLEESVKGANNVIPFFDRVDDRDMAPLLDLSDILIMPYDKRSASNSGTGRLAFSYGKTVITPAISSMKSIPEELIYEYDYSSWDEHYPKMYEQLCHAYEDWEKSPYILADKGQKLFEIMETDYSKETIIQKYREIFEQLLSD